MDSKKELMSDQRFSRITKDPRFWEMPEKERKIKIDKRFQAMFHDKKFKLKYTVDKRGRPIQHSSTEDLKRFYDLSDSDSNLSESDHKQTEKKAKGRKSKSKGERGPDKSVDSKESKVTDESSAILKSEVLENEGQKSASSMSRKNVKDTNKDHVPKKQNKQDVIAAESTSQKSSQKSIKEKTVKECHTEGFSAHKRTELAKEIEPSVSPVSKKCLETKSHQDEESFDPEESEGTGESEEESASEDEEETGDESETDGDESDSGPDLARGKGNVETSSEDEEENDLTDIFPEEPEVIHEWGELAKDAPREDKITHRLAVCNMNWDRLKAKDLLALLNSFTPKGGAIFSVKIYPSEFGKERMKEEEVNGPKELLSFPEDVTEKDSIFKEILRDYQFKRLRYFYAVVECDSPETANQIYEECDGLEFESSCSFVDLRFIPDDVTFDDEPKDVASEVDGAAYKPKFFTSAAVATSKVDITWDETDHERVTSLNRTFKKEELLDMDFQAYLASSSDEEEEEMEEHQGLKESADEMVRNKLEAKDKLTPWEQFLEKKKEKRKLKKKQKDAAEEIPTEDECPSDVDLNDPYFAEELEKADLDKKKKKKEDVQEKEGDTEKHKAEMALLVMDEEEDEKRHFNYEKIVEQQNLSKKKKKLLMKKKELLTDDFQVNVADTRFQAMYTSHLFNLDPSDPNFKKTKATEKILEEKARRRQQGLTGATGGQDNMAERQSAAKKPIDPALSMLIKSVKNKTEQFQARKKQKVK
ncbi:ESF1 homolog isoform X4 [Varanus komodoensis]|uniref:ESF1 homolog isoform X4 n=1 Tax=Varanus komodoensis TaxID=61221 RepID=UPI001CF7CF56|nr:ESF1 homolog isoform X4 [Varanus komodoensis]